MKKKGVVITSLAVLLCMFVVLGILYMIGQADWLMRLFYHPDRANNPEAVAVNFSELEAFLDSSEVVTVPSTRDCHEYARDLHNEAEANGIKAAIVLTRIKPMNYHAFNAFPTADKGIIYADASVGWDIGKCGIAELVDGVYIAKVESDGRVKTQYLGYEKDFIFYW